MRSWERSRDLPKKPAHAQVKSFAAKENKSAPAKRNVHSAVHSSLSEKARIQRAKLRQIVQPRLKVGAPDDQYEQEADRVADRVVANQPITDISSVSGAPLTTQNLQSQMANEQLEIEHQPEEEEEQAQPKLLQRQAEDEEEEEEEELQTRLMQRQPEEEELVQPKFLQRQAAEEEELQTSLLQRQPEEEEPIQTWLLQRQLEEEEEAQPKLLQRQAKEEEEEEQPIQTSLLQRLAQQEDEEAVQAKGDTSAPHAASQAVSKRSAGVPLRADVHSTLETGMGADLSGVRVHDDSAAQAAAASINARAFTHKNDIWLGEGQSQSDVRLMAHEATHVVQQGGGLRAMGISRSATRVQRLWNPISAVADAVGSAVEWVGDSISDALGYIKEQASEFVQGMPGYSLFTVVNGSDPISGRHVERNGRNFIEAGLDVIPNGASLKQKLEEEGALEEAAQWLDAQILELDFSPSEIASQLSNFWSSLGIADVTRLPTVMNRLLGIISAPVGRIIRFAENVARMLLQIIKDYVVSSLINFIREQTNAYPLLTVILGRDPISNETVERTPMALLRGFMQLSESGQEQLRQMEESGSLQRAADWLDGAIERLNISVDTIPEAFTAAWELVTIQNLLNPIGTFYELYNIFAGPVGRIINFLIEVAAKVLGLIKDALISRLVAYARTVRAYPLITVILGKDPFSQESVERSTANIIRGFMSLMENGEQQYLEMEQSGAIARMTARVEAAMAMLNITWEYIRGLFTRAWNRFSLQDLVAPFEAFARLMAIFGGPIMRLINFIWEIIKIVIEVVMEVMNFPIALIRNIITRAMQAIEDIKRDPVGFLKNLLRAVKTGFQQFFGNILTHLLSGLTGWLFSELRDANINPPADFSFRSILAFVLEVLGITVERIWEKLVERIGAERVARIRGMIDRLTGIWTFVKDVATHGPIAIWEYIQERLGNLWDTVLGAIRNWVMTRIIERVTVRLLSMLDPTGIMAVINGFIAFYNAVQSFIRYLREMLEVVNSFVVGVAELARSNVTIAANFLEGALARAMPIAIGFLANQVGLSGIGRRIGEMIERVREMVDRALTWLVDRAVSAGTAFLNTLRRGAGAIRESVAGLFNWLGIRKRIQTKDGNRHTLFFKGEGRNAKLSIRSQEQEVEHFLERNRTDKNHNNIDAAKLNYQDVRARQDELYRLEQDIITLERARQPAGPKRVEHRAKSAQLRTKTNVLGDAIAQLDIGEIPELATSNVRQHSDGVIAEPLSELPGNTTGSEATNNALPSWRKLLLWDDERGFYQNNWVKMHLIHHNLHGPGMALWNLASAPKSVNRQFLSTAEQPAINKIRKGRDVLTYRTQVVYQTDANISGFPKHVYCHVGEMEYKSDSRRWEQKGSPVRKIIKENIEKPSDISGSSVISIKNLSEGQAAQLLAIRTRLARQVAQAGTLAKSDGISFRVAYRRLFSSVADVDIPEIETAVQRYNDYLSPGQKRISWR